jgi:hypothetical protein
MNIEQREHRELRELRELREQPLSRSGRGTGAKRQGEGLATLRTAALTLPPLGGGLPPLPGGERAGVRGSEPQASVQRRKITSDSEPPHPTLSPLGRGLLPSAKYHFAENALTRI